MFFCIFSNALLRHNTLDCGDAEADLDDLLDPGVTHQQLIDRPPSDLQTSSLEYGSVSERERTRRLAEVPD